MKNSPPFRIRSTPRTRLLFAVVGLCLPILGCGSATEPVLTTWEGELSPRPPGFIEGQVAAVTQFGRTQASIQIRNGNPDVVYTWRINAGTCDQEGLIQGGLASYQPLTPGEGGTAEANAVLDAVFRPGDQFAARVLRPDGGSETVVACGTLEQTR